MRNQFPIGVLPYKIKLIVEKVSNKIQVPRELAFNSLLSAISLASHKRLVVNNQFGGTYPVSIYSIAIADSGERKSSVDKLMFLPFIERDRKIQQSFEQAYADFILESKLWGTKEKVITKKLIKNIQDNKSTFAEEEQLKELNASKPKEPIMDAFIHNNITPASLLTKLAGQSKSTGLICDEGELILSKAVTSEISTFNLLWDDSNLIKVERKTSDSFEIQNARLTFNAMVQTAVFDEFKNKKSGKARTSGFLARCLPTLIDYSNSKVGSRSMDNTNQDSDPVITAYYEIINDILDEQLDDLDDLVMQISENALIIFKIFSDKVEQESSVHGRFFEIKDFISKIANNCLRIATLFQYFQSKNILVIDYHNMESAIKICEWYIYQALKIYTSDAVQMKTPENAQRLYLWLQSKFIYNSPSTSISRNEILQFGPSSTRKAKALDAAIDYLVANKQVSFTRDRNNYIFFNTNVANGWYYHS